MNEPKLCPLRPSAEPGYNHPCMGERCAWWSADRCAVLDIAQAAGEIGDISSALFDLCALRERQI